MILKLPCAISCVALCKAVESSLQVLAAIRKYLQDNFVGLATLKAMSSSANSFSLFPLRALQLKKERDERIAMISLYDAPTAALCCDVGVDIILVGDSLGNAVLGYDSTLQVTLDDMIRHTAAVARGVAKSTRPNVPVVADLPFATYHGALQTTIDNAAALMRAGAQSVKLEGASPDILRAIETLVAMGAPVVGHIGFTPQSSLTFARVVQGRDESSADVLQQQARDLQNAGCAMIVLEAVTREVAADITSELKIPTIGIGAGSDCDGQVLVWHDLVGLSPQTPRFVRQFANAHEILKSAARDYVQAVQSQEFPTDEHGWNQNGK